MTKATLNHLLRLVTVALMLAAVAIQRDGSVLGHNIAATSEPVDITSAASPVTTMDDGTMVITTGEMGKKIMGYGGPTPLTVKVKDGVVTDVVAGKNSESPEFFEGAFNYLRDKWVGHKVSEIQSQEPDAYTGATMSSNALNGNMQLALQQAGESTSEVTGAAWSASRIAVLIVALLGCILPLFKAFKKYRTLWLCVNVLVLGLWGGTFLSHALLVNWMSHGTNVLASLAVVLMLIAAFIYPLLGKKQYYCTWMCPMGSLQELAGKVNKKHKWHMSPTTAKCLSQAGEMLWAILMLLMLTGVWSAWMDYELFTAFLFTAASPVVIAVAILFVVLSAFVPRPYCRFVCPTGCLLRLAQDSK